ncbi:EAL domain-containing protein [Shewanella goraebulensis]|uniref:EAL domain-containing protein n=1 Tax=Shewanella goraebulensis TaxID=3050637 RepID=UPI00254F2890|nr:EAL domain-containing protein [Shewanella goraebulensis]
MKEMTNPIFLRWQESINLTAEVLNSNVFIFSLEENHKFSLSVSSYQSVETLHAISLQKLQAQLINFINNNELSTTINSVTQINLLGKDYFLHAKTISDVDNLGVALLVSISDIKVVNKSSCAVLTLAAENLTLIYSEENRKPIQEADSLTSPLQIPDAINLQNFINAFDEHIWIKNLSGQYVVCNESVDLAWNKSHSDIIGKYDDELFGSETAETFKDGDYRAIKANKPIVVGECERIDHQQNSHWLETIKAPLLDKDNDLVGVIGITRNIGRHKETQTQLMLAESVFENTVEGVLVTDRDGEITEVNTAFVNITGFSREEAVGKNPRILNSGKHDNLFFSQMWNTLLVKGKWHGEIWNKRKSGEIFPQLVTINAVYGQKDEINFFVAVFADISEQKITEEKLANLSYYDPLTQLPNRVLFRSKLQQQVDRAFKQQTQLAVVFFDIDFFKHINDSLGHNIGDKLLMEVGRRLSELKSEQCLVGRLSSDEFVILLTDLSQNDLFISQINQIKASIEQPFKLEDKPLIRITLSMGVSVFPSDSLNSEHLLQNTDTALHIAKQSGRNNVTYYDSAMTMNSVEHVKIQSALHEAIQENQFHLVYQPKLSLITGKLVGLETLIRWEHPVYGLISPAEFIPIAEKTGLIHEIGQQVLIMACKQGKQWLDDGYRFGHLAVNVASLQFQRTNFIDNVELILTETNFPAELLELEMTESCMMYEPERVISDLKRLGDLGIQLSVDDFGTGYSSLSYLKKLPINVLKIDQSFVADIPFDSNNTAIARAIIVLGHALKLTVIAEGVETKEQATFLLENGCDQAQGYYFSKPQLATSLTAQLPNR